jgi:hypothetical protein
MLKEACGSNGADIIYDSMSPFPHLYDREGRASP